MYITDVTITDLKCFRGTHSFSLQHTDGSYAGWTVFAGRNGAGKTTLLKAIALPVAGPNRGNAQAGTFRNWVCHGHEFGTSRLKLAIDRDSDRYVEKIDTSIVTSGIHLWHIEGENPSIAFDKSDLQYINTELRWNEGNDEPARPVIGAKEGANKAFINLYFGPWAGSPQGWFCVAYGAQRRLGPAPADIRRYVDSPAMARIIHLFNESATLTDSVEWLQGIHLRALEKKNGAADLKSAVLRVLDDGLLPDGSRVVDVDSDGLWLERDGVRLPLEQVSDGYRTVTALVADILRQLHTCYGHLPIEEGPDGHTVCNLPGVVLIDEVDAHLHVSWQQRIGFWLTSRFPRIQFLVTTHSPFICQAASPGGIIRLPAPGEETRIAPISEEAWKAIVRGGADDAVMTELFGLDHPHSDATENLLRELARLEVRVLRGTATTEEIAEYRALREKLPSDMGSRAEQVRRTLMP